MKVVESFVVMFDFLGFKALRKERGTAGLYDLYKKGLLPHIQHSAALKGKTVIRDGKSVYVPDPGPFSVEYHIVSDSILLFAHGNTLDHFIRIVAASHRLLCGSFAGHKAALRGAIGYGDLIVDPNSIWIGSAIEDAYSGENCQVWAGCALTPACERFVLEKGYITQSQEFFVNVAKSATDERQLRDAENARKRLVRYPVPEQYNPKTGPVQYSSREGYVLDWTLNLYEGAGEKGLAEASNSHALKIKENTVAFEKWARTNNRP